MLAYAVLSLHLLLLLLKPFPLLAAAVAQTAGNLLPPVYYTMSSLANLFSFTHLWAGTNWTAPQLLAVQSGLVAYIANCSSYTGGAVVVVVGC